MVVWAFFMRFCTATMGAKNNSLGSPPALAYAVTRASGLRPCALANASDVTTNALAPSFNPGALPGVTVPSCWKDGLSAASASSEVSLRGPSSFSTTVGPFFPGISMGTISALKRHAAIAATAFWWLASANASWSARDTPAFLAVYSARLPMWVFEKESHNPSWIMPSTSWLLPALIPPRIPYTAKRSEEHTSELQSLAYLVCRLLLEK